MRSIKFRVWNNRKKEWIHGPGEECNLFGECILFGAFMNVSLDELNDCIALQYTGVKDKNSLEVYENDLLVFDRNIEGEKEYKYTVVFNNGKFELECPDIKMCIDIGYCREMNVVRNIFEK